MSYPLIDVLSGSDEYEHAPDWEAWQENYVFYGHTEDLSTGMSLHLQHVASSGAIDVRAGVFIDGEFTTMVGESEGNSCLSAPGLSVRIEEPFRKMSLHYEGRGRRGLDRDGWLFRSSGDVPFGFDLTLTTNHSPVLVSALTSTMFDQDEGKRDLGVWFGHNHYELGAVMEGRVWSGDDYRDVRGLVLRDHTWGPRELRFSELFWTPVVTDNAEAFVAAQCTLADGVWAGYAIVAEGFEQPRLYHDMWVRTDAGSSDGPITAADALLVGANASERIRFRDGLHVPAGRKNTFADGQQGLINVFSRIEWGGRRGLGTIQHVPKRLVLT